MLCATPDACGLGKGPSDCGAEGQVGEGHRFSSVAQALKLEVSLLTATGQLDLGRTSCHLLTSQVHDTALETLTRCLRSLSPHHPLRSAPTMRRQIAHPAAKTTWRLGRTYPARLSKQLFRIYSNSASSSDCGRYGSTLTGGTLG